ncbi:MAG TPA: hypothetical protein ENI55_01510 [Alphaproteobacteria bacterium]|nr:hypothetical protein [Alphaproteobacteria bacterium]
MTVLTQGRNTPKRDGVTRDLPVAAATRIFAGSLVVLDAAGNAEPATTALAKVAVGRAEEQVDNLTGVAGDQTVKVSRGVFLFANEPTDPIAAADIAATCFIVDDQTVAKTDAVGTRSAAGKVFAVDGQGVWVEIQ